MQQDDLFHRHIVSAYVDQPRFLRRDWLAREAGARLQDPTCRFILLLAPPGAGKSALIAQLARDHDGWLTYFIRRDQRTPLDSVGARAFLLHIGYQFAALHPELFAPKQLQLDIRQQIGSVDEGGQVIAARVKELIASPFYQKILQIRQQVQDNRGSVVGLTIDKLVVDTHAIDLSDLQALALFNPANALLKRSPTEQLVILVDALDEVRYQEIQDTFSVLQWLSNCPELPPNVRFILTSRPPDGPLRTFWEKQKPYVRTLTINAEDARVTTDLLTYASALVAGQTLAAVLTQMGQNAEAFAASAVAKANGNIGYLDALARGIDQALPKDEGHEPGRALRALLALRELPGDLVGLFAFFLHQVMADAARYSVEIPDPVSGETRYVPAWSAVYSRVLGALAVVREPLTLSQIKVLGGIGAGWADLTRAIDHLRQFLELENNRYRLYHATLPEFLTDSHTRALVDTADLYADPQEWHRRIADYFWNNFYQDWGQCDDDYGLNHLATHLFEMKDTPRLQALVSQTWMQTRYQHGGFTHTGFLSDLDTIQRAIIPSDDDRSNLLPLVRLYTAREVVRKEVSAYSDTDLQTLVWLGRESEAKSHARLRQMAGAQCSGLLAITDAWGERTRQDPTLLDEAWNLARIILDKQEQARILSRLSVAMVKAGRYADAQDAVHAIQYAPFLGEAQHHLAVALVRAGRFDEAKELARIVPDERQRVNALWQVAVALAPAQASQAQAVFAEAEQSARAIADAGFRASALCDLAVALTEVGFYDAARRVARRIKDGENKANALVVLGNVLAQAHDGRAGEVLAAAERAARAIPFETDRAFAQIDLWAVLMRTGDRHADEVLAKVEQLARKLSPFGMDRPQQILGKLAAALAALGDHRADPLFREAEQIAIRVEGYIAEEWRDQVDNEFQVLARYLLSAGRLDQVRHVISLMRSEGSQARMLAEAAAALAQTGRYAESEQVAKSIKDLEQRAVALSVLAASLAQAGNAEAGRVFAEVAAAARARYNSPDAETLRKVGIALARARRYAVAEGVIRSISSEDARAEAFYELLSSMLREKCYSGAGAIARSMPQGRKQAQALHDVSIALAELEKFEESEALAQAIPDTWQNGLAYSDLADLVEAHAWSRADEVGDALAIAEFRGEAYRHLGAALACAGRYPASERIARSISPDWIRAAALSELALEFTRVKDGRADSLFAEAMAVRQAMKDARDRDVVSMRIARGLAQAGEFDRAKSLIDQTSDSPDTRRARINLALKLTDAGQFERVRRMAKGNFEYSWEVLPRLATAMAQQGLYADAQVVARSIQDQNTRVTTLHDLAVAMAQGGKYPEAEATARSIEDELTRARTLADLAAAGSVNEQGHVSLLIRDARSTARAIVNLTKRSEALCYVASALAGARDRLAREVFAEAEAIANLIEDSDSRTSALEHLADAMGGAGQFSDALRVMALAQPHAFIRALADWSPAFERVRESLSVEVLAEAIEVSAWESPSWQTIGGLLHAPPQSVSDDRV